MRSTTPVPHAVVELTAQYQIRAPVASCTYQCIACHCDSVCSSLLSRLSPPRGRVQDCSFWFPEKHLGQPPRAEHPSPLVLGHPDRRDPRRATQKLGPGWSWPCLCRPDTLRRVLSWARGQQSALAGAFYPPAISVPAEVQNTKTPQSIILGAVTFLPFRFEADAQHYPIAPDPALHMRCILSSSIPNPLSTFSHA